MDWAPGNRQYNGVHGALSNGKGAHVRGQKKFRSSVMTITVRLPVLFESVVQHLRPNVDVGVSVIVVHDDGRLQGADWAEYGADVTLGAFSGFKHGPWWSHCRSHVIFDCVIVGVRRQDWRSQDWRSRDWRSRDWLRKTFPHCSSATFVLVNQRDRFWLDQFMNEEGPIGCFVDESLDV